MSWNGLYNPLNNSKKPEFDAVRTSQLDMLFNDFATGVAYVTLHLDQPDHECSVLSLTHADVWLTTMATSADLSKGRGGSCDSMYSDVFTYLLPKCVEEILFDVGTIIGELFPK